MKFKQKNHSFERDQLPTYVWNFCYVFMKHQSMEMHYFACLSTRCMSFVSLKLITMLYHITLGSLNFLVFAISSFAVFVPFMVVSLQILIHSIHGFTFGNNYLVTMKFETLAVIFSLSTVLLCYMVFFFPCKP